MFHSLIDEQMWIVKWNNAGQGYEIQNAASTGGYLVDGDSVNTGVYTAAYSSSKSENIELSLLSNGAMKVEMLIDGEMNSLGVINNSFSAEQVLTWEKQNNTNKISQEWYLEKCCYLKGDVNRSGTITSADYSIILNHIYYGFSLDNAEMYLADMNGDGILTVEDANAVAAIVNAQ